MAHHVIKTFVLLLFLLFKGNAQQENKAYFSLIDSIIGSDTLLKHNKASLLTNRIKNGLMTEQDSIDYIKSIRDTKLFLFDTTVNENAKQWLLKSMKERNNPLVDYLGRNVVKGLIMNTPPERKFKNEEVSDEIKLISVAYIKYMHYNSHYFSSPLKVKDSTFIMYHSYQKGSANSLSEFIVFSSRKKNNNYGVIKTFLLYHH